MSKSRIVLALAIGVASIGLTLVINGRTPARPLSPEAHTALSLIQRSPAEAGQAVYEGSVFAVDGHHPPLFRYERRVQPVADGLRSTHITFNPTGDVVVMQSATHSFAYELTRADLIHGQTGVSGSVEARGRQLTFTLVQNGKSSVATEEVASPVVTGPTMFGYIVTHWDELMSGASLPIRFALIERKETIGFTLAKVAAPAGRTAIRMTPSSPLLKLFVPSTSFEFDTATRKVLEYTGRVPPMETVGGRLRALDARVTYDFKAPAFR